MRKALNDNPMVQMAVIAVLALVGGFFLLNTMSGRGSSEPAPAPAGTPASVTTAVTPASAPAGQPIPLGPLVPGSGLPRRVLASYAKDDVVVVLIVRNGGIDDNLVRVSVESLNGTPGVSVFVAHSGDIAKYAQITQGVGVDRVPALVVVRPRSLNEGSPVASVSYGFRSPESVRQAIHNAVYDGPQRAYDPG
jgi:hypothetical protein